jgi:hypothetical protein
MRATLGSIESRDRDQQEAEGQTVTLPSRLRSVDFATGYMGVGATLRFDPFDITLSPGRLLGWGAAAGNRSIADLWTSILGGRWVTSESTVAGSDSPVVSRAAIGAAWVGLATLEASKARKHGDPIPDFNDFIANSLQSGYDAPKHDVIAAPQRSPIGTGRLRSSSSPSPSPRTTDLRRVPSYPLPKKEERSSPAGSLSLRGLHSLQMTSTSPYGSTGRLRRISSALSPHLQELGVLAEEEPQLDNAGQSSTSVEPPSDDTAPSSTHSSPSDSVTPTVISFRCKMKSRSRPTTSPGGSGRLPLSRHRSASLGAETSTATSRTADEEGQPSVEVASPAPSTPGLTASSGSSVTSPTSSPASPPTVRRRASGPAASPWFIYPSDDHAPASSSSTVTKKRSESDPNRGKIRLLVEETFTAGDLEDEEAEQGQDDQKAEDEGVATATVPQVGDAARVDQALANLEAEHRQRESLLGLKSGLKGDEDLWIVYGGLLEEFMRVKSSLENSI